MGQESDLASPETWSAKATDNRIVPSKRGAQRGMFPFMLGEEYSRHRLLDYVGSRQAQSGVLWGKKESRCILCTSGGRHGKKAGYSDEPLPDGGWWYFGQGTTGDQDLANAANSRLASERYSVLLFTTREPTAKEIAAQQGYGKLFAYRGIYNVAGYEFHTPNLGNRAGERLLRFRLVPAVQAQSVEDGVEYDDVPAELHGLRRWIEEAAGRSSQVTYSIAQYRKRSACIRKYAKMRANGLCEACGGPAPFLDSQGQPFLEVHHLLRLADDGPDSPMNVAAICPNCHRQVHVGGQGDQLNEALREKIMNIECAQLG